MFQLVYQQEKEVSFTFVSIHNTRDMEESIVEVRGLRVSQGRVTL